MTPPTKAQWDKWMAARELPEKTLYYIPDVSQGVASCEGYVSGIKWRDKGHIKRNLASRTMNAAIVKARKMLAAIKEQTERPET